MKKIIAIFIALFPILLYAHEISGIITDVNNDPLSDVYVIHKRSNNYSITDNKGKFILANVAEGDTLSISHIGYSSKTIVVKNADEMLTVALETDRVIIDEINISRNIDAITIFSEIDLQTTPVTNAQEILTKLPGLIIGQHAGGGKAEQIFLRGFDIDHGTDISIEVDGMPVNMVSHAHGQGYADLHFVIPETIDKIEYGKGSYYADKGNFATAGFVEFKTKERLAKSLVQAEYGSFNTFRGLGMFNLLNNNKHSAYIASEYIATDGPFDSPQNFNRINIFGKYTGKLNNRDKIGLIFSYFSSKWDASGQIPQRAVDDGTIGRFGAIDDTEGGNTGRINAQVSYEKYINESSFIKNAVTFSQYDFELFSNFTFFLEDPENGDQIRQKEDRLLLTVNSEYNKFFSIKNMRGSLQVGGGLRNDRSKDNELSRTVNRKTILEYVQLGDINETNFYGYINSDFKIGKWTINPGLRVDQFNFQYNDALDSLYSTQTASKAIFSPKLNILFNASKSAQIYFKAGKGFHSNDTRVSVPQDGNQILPASYGFDIGAIFKPIPKMVMNIAFWQLYLEQEFVYVGDAGIVEPSGKTQRLGVDFGIRYQPVDWLTLHTDVNYAYARSIEEQDGEDFIPLAPDLTVVGGIGIQHPKGFYGGVNYRYLKDRPANEDNSIVADGYFIMDLSAGYQWRRLNFGIQINNLLNSDWNETQFATESRLQNEAESVEEIHFTPGTSFFIRGVVAFQF